MVRCQPQPCILLQLPRERLRDNRPLEATFRGTRCQSSSRDPTPWVIRCLRYVCRHARPEGPKGADAHQLNDRSLLKEAQTYVNGQWVGAKSGKTFEVHGKHRSLCRLVAGHVSR